MSQYVRLAVDERDVKLDQMLQMFEHMPLHYVVATDAGAERAKVESE